MLIRDRYRKPHALLLLFAVLLMLCIPAGPAGAEERLSLLTLEKSMALAAHYMARQGRKDGMFHYHYDFLQDKFLKKDNYVRQAGAGYGLAEYYNRTGDEAVRKRLVGALAAYRDSTVSYSSGGLFAKGKDLAKARTGSTALALLTELLYWEKSGDSTFAGLRKKWLTGLLALRRPGGGFRKTPGTEMESPYFNGESWLAVAHYARLNPEDVRVQEVLVSIDAYMIARYGLGNFNQSFYHWGSMAAAVRFATTRDMKYFAFMENQNLTYLAVSPAVRSRVNACYSIEGLTAFALVLAGRKTSKPDYYKKIKQRITAEIENSLSMQIQPGQKRIIFGEDSYLYAKNLGKFAGAFLNGRYRPSARIDFTQHCLSALAKYRDILVK